MITTALMFGIIGTFIAALFIREEWERRHNKYDFAFTIAAQVMGMFEVFMIYKINL